MVQAANATKVIQDEFEQFRRKILELPKEAVFDHCNQVRFYHCIREYFAYNEKIPKQIITLVDRGAFTICGAWLFYIKHEDYSCDTWEEISEMILAMYKRRRWREIKYAGKRINRAVY